METLDKALAQQTSLSRQDRDGVTQHLLARFEGVYGDVRSRRTAMQRIQQRLPDSAYWENMAANLRGCSS
jgi:predicted transcriptional regulator